MDRGSTVLNRKCSVVNREPTGVMLSRDRGNVGMVRTQFIFYKTCPGASRYTGCPAPGCTVDTPAQENGALTADENYYAHNIFKGFFVFSCADIIFFLKKKSLQEP